MARGASTVPKPRTAARPSQALREEEIAQLAYAFFEQRGKQHGADQQDWFDAERLLRARQRGAPS